MNDRFFLDTNILVYAIDPEEPIKHATAKHLVNWGFQSGLAVISYQVVQEWFNFSLNRAKQKLSNREAAVLFHRVWGPLWKVNSSSVLIESALSLRQDFNFSWYDSLIVAAALEANCRTLYSEDLQHGLRIGDLTIQNPFNQSTN
jgi:predicted nucleic acid-binding protein